MTLGWVDRYVVSRIDGRPGLTFRENPPFRFTIHSTEGSKIEGALAQYRKGTGPPHFTVEFGRDLKRQHVPINLGAYALRNDPGGVQTNAIPNVQIEWVGFAHQGYLKSIPELDWFAGILAEICEEALALGMIDESFELEWPEFYDDRSGFTLATKTAKQRLLDADWNTGRWTLLGHQHVPENTHWDPGKVDWQYVDAKFRTLFPKDQKVTPPEPPSPPLHELTEYEWRRLKETDENLRRRDDNFRARIISLETAVDVLEERIATLEEGQPPTEQGVEALGQDVATLDKLLSQVLKRVNEISAFQAAIVEAVVKQQQL